MEQYPAQVEKLVAAGDYTGAHALIEQDRGVPLPREVVRLSPTCAGQEKGASCWMELAKQHGCYAQFI